MAEFNNPERAFEDAPRMGRPSIITTQENIEAVERIIMRNLQVSVRRLAEELTIIHEIMDNQLDMKKVCIRWILNLLKPIQRVNHVDCCQESEVNPDNFFHSIITGDESWFATTIFPASWKPRSERGQVNKHQLDCSKKD